jgi:hypothetical protein
MAAMGEGAMKNTQLKVADPKFGSINLVPFNLGSQALIHPTVTFTVPTGTFGGSIMREGFISGTGPLVSGAVSGNTHEARPISPFVHPASGLLQYTPR